MTIKWKEFGADVYEHRQACSLSVRDLGKKYDISHATVSRADRGLPVSAETFLILTSYFLDIDPRVYLK
jgi:hypothetical protein